MLTSPLSAAPLPPGQRSLPWLGETLSIVRDPLAFMDMRRARFGDVFRVSLMGQQAVFVTGDAARQAFADPQNVSRQAARSWRLHGSLGDAHWGLRELLLRAATAQALAHYGPAVAQLAQGCIVRAAEAGAGAWIPRFKQFGFDAACDTLLGLGEGPARTALRLDHESLCAAAFALPNPLPGSGFVRGQAARRRILKTLRTAVVRLRAEGAGDTGVQRILRAQRDDGLRINDAEAALELHHVLLICCGVSAPLAHLFMALDTDPRRAAALQVECRALSDADLGSPATLAALPTLDACLSDALRNVPLSPLVSGTAARTFELQGYRIPAGWDIYVDARGGGDTVLGMKALSPRSLGMTLKRFIAQGIVAAIVRDYDVHLPAQDLTLTCRSMPPEPRDGLRLVLTPAATHPKRAVG